MKRVKVRELEIDCAPEADISDLLMAWATPQYKHEVVDRAGRTLVTGWDGEDLRTFTDYADAVGVVDNWRSSHNFPLNTFQATLRRKARQVDPDSLVAQRIKRLSSIELKLSRLDTLRLSQMQDIGGCRAVVSSIAQLERLVKNYKDSDLKHMLSGEKDYVREPRSSGYRGAHLIYTYKSDKTETWNGLKVEMQFRTPLQHAWATAVETVGTFTRHALKSSLGPDEWLRFFSLMSSAIAMREMTTIIPGVPTDPSEMLKELEHYSTRLDVEARLRSYGEALDVLETPGAKKAHYFLLRLDPSAKSVQVTGFLASQLALASEEYLKSEQELRSKPGSDAVLVSVESLSALRRAYPNYFLDTDAFIEALRVALQK